MLSRTANDLYWMARYMERAENVARMLDVTYRMSLLPYRVMGPGEKWAEPWVVPLVVTGLVTDYYERYKDLSAESVLRYMVLDADNPSSVYSAIRTARENGRAQRGALSAEMWECLNGTWIEMRSATYAAIEAQGVSEFFEWVKTRSQLFRGITYGTMLRDEGYSFIRIATFLERADNTARILDVKYHTLLPSVLEVGGAVDYYQWSALLRSVGAFESYRKIYRDIIVPRRVAELLILREDVPCSLHNCMQSMNAIVEHLGGGVPTGETGRLAGEIYSQLRYSRIESIIEVGLHEWIEGFLEGNARLQSELNAQFLAPA